MNSKALRTSARDRKEEVSSTRQSFQGDSQCFTLVLLLFDFSSSSIVSGAVGLLGGITVLTGTAVAALGVAVIVVVVVVASEVRCLR